MRFARRAVIVGLLFLVIGLLWLAREPALLTTMAGWAGFPVRPTIGPTPPPPALADVPRGELPAGPAGLREWARYPGQAAQPVGSGFVLRTPAGRVVAVTTAHSVDVHRLAGLALHLPGADTPLLTLTRLHGAPGEPRHGLALDGDYLLFEVPTVVEAPILAADPRGGPAAGERVIVSSGLDGAVLTGTVTAASAEAIWLQMDQVFNPSGLSGSPVLSTHTGLVVGMVVAASDGPPVLLGLHPIGSLTSKAEAADDNDRHIGPGP